MSQTKAQLIDPVDGTIVNADINASAAIAGSKISPDFGSQNIVTTGSVGIGIGSQTPSTPQKQLHIAHDSSPRIMLSNDTTGHATPNGTELLLDSGGNFEILQRENLNVEFFTNNSQRMTINGSGNVGVGIASPSTLLHIESTDPTFRLKRSDGSAYGEVTADTAGLITFKSDPGQNAGSNGFIFTIDNTEKVKIDDAGNLDINGAPWTITGGNYRNLSISGSDGASAGFLWMGNGAATTNADFDLARINFVNNTTITSQIAASTQTSANDDGRLSFHTKATGSSLTERMRIDSSGRVQIGSTNNSSTGTKFVVGSGNNIAATTVINTQDTDINALTLSNWDGSTTTNKVIVGFDNSGRGSFSMGMPASSADFIFANSIDGASLERVRILAAGHLLPGSDNAQDLGSSSKRWRNIYTNDLKLSNKGSENDVDGTWGNYTIQEGHEDLFLINHRTGKKFKFNLTEVA
jgi:hypothetical protein